MKLIKVGSQYIWLWWVFAVGPKHRQILQLDIYFEKSTLIVAERFLFSLLDKYDKHPTSTVMEAHDSILHKHVDS